MEVTMLDRIGPGSYISKEALDGYEEKGCQEKIEEKVVLVAEPSLR
jgi:hypothetical protein